MAKINFKRGQIVQHVNEEWMAIFLSYSGNNSYILKLSDSGAPLSIAMVITIELKEPFNIPKQFEQIDITI